MVSAQERFIVVPYVLTNNEQMVILTDYNYWADHESDLEKWCLDNSSQVNGMTVVFPNAQTLTVFCLRWS
jgi:hypothetical protein